MLSSFFSLTFLDKIASLSARFFPFDFIAFADFFTKAISPTIFPFLINGFVSISNEITLPFRVFISRL